MRIKLHWRLTFIFYFVFILVLLIGYFYLIPQLRLYFEHSLKNNIKNQLFLDKHLLEKYLIDEDTFIEDADAISDRMGEELGIRVTIIGIDGVVLGDSDLSKEELKYVENHLDRLEIKKAQENGFGISKRFSRTVKKDLLYMAVPLGKDNSLGFLRFAIPLRDIELFEAKLKRIVFLALLLMLGFGLLLFFSLSSYISKPLLEMVEIAKSYAKGNFLIKPPLRLKDEIGELAKALSIMSEEIKNKIEKIEQDKTSLDAVLSSMFEGIIVTDKNGEITLMNPSLKNLFSINNSLIQGRRPIEIIRYIDVQSIVDEIIEGKQKFVSEEVKINLPEEKILKINGTAIIRDDKLEGAVLVFHDITELRRLEKIRQDFVANVSHELRTPVSSIKGYAETLLEGAMEDRKNLSEFISIIYNESNRLANLIDDLLDLSKIESGKMEMLLRPLEIINIVKKCVNILENKAREKSITVSLDIPKNLPKVLGDDKRLSQVFLNLLDNAIKYNQQGGSINISIFVKNRFLQVDISDTGIGISQKDIPRIFERFYRVDKGRSRQLGGTGLGLSIVKHIIQAHRGQVWVNSELGKGSTFSFTIPLV
ncbi:MAG: cell wall metabolism sensor histidine kinase WalK [Candidatus Omnitrophica bacterium]|nr:cell wall metabolism sensor histidine kinase WalK [Candidatus Omnitrophota bacterium]